MCVCSCMYMCKLPAQSPGLAAKPLLDQCRGPGWPSNSLSLMKNKPLNHRDCLQRRGKGTIPSTLHPPRGSWPQRETQQRLYWTGWDGPTHVPVCPSVSMGRAFSRHNPGKPLGEKPPPTQLQPLCRQPGCQAHPQHGRGIPAAGTPLCCTTAPCCSRVSGSWMPGGHGEHEMLKVPPLGQERFVGCSAGGGLQHCRVKEELRGQSLLRDVTVPRTCTGILSSNTCPGKGLCGQ